MLTGRLASLFQIRPGEGRLVALLMALTFLPSAGGAIGSPSVEALFYARFGVQYLPYLYVALGLVTLVTSLVLTALLGRLPRQRLYLALPVILAGALIIARLLVALRLHWFYPVLWLGMYLLWTLQSLFTWGLAGTVCNSRQAKRLFPLFGAGGILGIALGGLITRWLVGLIGAENLLLVWAGALAVTFLIVRDLTRGLPSPRARQRPARLTDDLQRGYRFVQRSPLMRWIGAAALLLGILLFAIAFPFSQSVARQFPSEDALTGFLGLFQGATTAVAFLAALFAANRLYAWLGFMGVLLALPLIYLGGFALLLAANTFAVLVVFRFIQMAWLQGVSTTAYQAVFNVVPPHWREQTRTFIDGVPTQAGTIVVGLALIAAGPRLLPWHLYAGGLLTALLAAAVIWRARQAYGQALAEALRAGQPQMFLSEERPFGGLQRDAAAVEALVRGVADPDPVVRRVSAEILGSVTVPAAVSAAVQALSDPDLQVRQAALRSLAQAQAAPALLEVVALLRDPEPEAREQAVETLRRLAGYPGGLSQHLQPLLDDASPAVRSRAAVALLQSSSHPQAAASLRQMAADNEPETRALAMSALAAWGDPSTYDLAANALGDISPFVRRAAVPAVARLDSLRCLAPLVQALGDEDAAVRERVGQMLSGLGQRAQASVLEALNDPRLEAGALRALEQMPLTTAGPALQAYAGAQVSRAGQYRAWQRGLHGFEPDDERLRLLRDSLADAARKQALRGIHAVGLLADRAAVALALQGLNSPSSSQQANALETIDNWTGRDALRPVLALWDSGADTSASAGGPAGPPPEPLHALTPILHDTDAWLRACAALAAGGHADASLQGQLARLAESDTDPLVRATSAAALERAAPRLAAGPDQTQGEPNMQTLATLSIMDRILFLKRVRLFSTLPPAELKQVAAIALEQYYLAGEVITRQGEPGDEMYIIVSGQVRVVAGADPRSATELARRGPGDYVGEMAIISQEPRMASLISEGDTRLLCIERTQFEAILRERPEASLAVMRMLIARIKEIQTVSSGQDA